MESPQQFLTVPFLAPSESPNPGNTSPAEVGTRGASDPEDLEGGVDVKGSSLREMISRWKRMRRALIKEDFEGLHYALDGHPFPHRPDLSGSFRFLSDLI